MTEEMARSMDDLRQLQALPLSLKVRLTQDRIRQWVNEIPGVYISFSGGKDSTVLLDIARQMYPDLPAVFVDTGLEYPEIRDFVRTFENVEWLKPKMNFRQVIEKYGYPMISKEVSECVYGARKYLTRIAEQESLGQTDRQTDNLLTPSFIVSCADKASTQNLTGGGTTESTENSEDSQNLPIRMGKTHRERTILTAMDRAKRDYTHTHTPAAQSGDSPISWESERLKTALTQDFTKTIDNVRIQRLMAILPTRGKATAETDFSKTDRSMFSCARYQFFLDAPFEISNQCCNIMKKGIAHAYQKRTGRYPMTAEMAEESRLRMQNWLHYGCNGFDMKSPKSMPMAFWAEQDVLQYIYRNDLPICEIYGEVVPDYEVAGQLDGQMSLFPDSYPLKTTGMRRTGCMFCGFGCHMEKSPGRFELMKHTHPKQYEYIMKPWDKGGLGYKEVIDWINEHGNLNIRY